jgi:hypothetical protein
MRFSSLSADEFMRVAKLILKGDPKGNKFIQDMVNDIVRELKDQEYKDAMGYEDEGDDGLSGIDFSDLGL